jgi:hypothetical protein
MGLRVWLVMTLGILGCLPDDPNEVTPVPDATPTRGPCDPLDESNFVPPKSVPASASGSVCTAAEIQQLVNACVLGKVRADSVTCVGTQGNASPACDQCLFGGADAAAQGAFIAVNDYYTQPNSVGCAQMMGDGGCALALATAEACDTAACVESSACTYTYSNGTSLCMLNATIGTCALWQRAFVETCADPAYTPCLLDPSQAWDYVAFATLFCGNGS